MSESKFIISSCQRTSAKLFNKAYGLTCGSIRNGPIVICFPIGVDYWLQFALSMIVPQPAPTRGIPLNYRPAIPGQQKGMGWDSGVMNYYCSKEMLVSAADQRDGNSIRFFCLSKWMGIPRGAQIDVWKTKPIRIHIVRWKSTLDNMRKKLMRIENNIFIIFNCHWLIEAYIKTIKFITNLIIFHFFMSFYILCYLFYDCQ